MSDTNYFYEVGVNAPIDSTLTYSWGSHELTKGTSVNVSLGKRKVKGVILDSVPNHDSKFSIKEINNLSEERPLLPNKFLSWCQWVSDYYFYPIGMVIEHAFPPLKKNSNRKTKYQVIPDIEQDQAPNLTDEQLRVLQKIKSEKKINTHLLHGVTGSGKTEVYLNLINDCITNNKSAIVLVPEISLTPQLLNRFSARFKDQVAIIHSQLTAREKTNQWWAAFSGNKKILIGARSALFCPIKNLGLIIIDEEHESSFKQEEKLKYHARDAAIVLAKMHNCPIILGSATPSLESYSHAKVGKYNYLQMKNRVHQKVMPQTLVIDLKKERETREIENTNKDNLPFWLSQKLYDQIKVTLNNKKQTALFLNRRGIAQVVVCPDCGYVYECPNCEISLTLHRKKDLTCHYCSYSDVYKEKCPSCTSIEIKPLGLGTEKIEVDIKKLFPCANVERVDRDKVSNRHQLESIITGMENQTIDILIGTQMIAKGLDFKYLQTVGLVLADVAFNLPNFRSNERSFQLITQVSGRAGRNKDDSGVVIIQAYNTEHPSITHALSNNFEAFASEELKMRESVQFPPTSRLALLRISSSQLNHLNQSTDRLREFCEQYKEKTSHEFKVRLLGPSQAPLYKLKNNYRHQMLILSENHQYIRHFCKYLLSNKKKIFTSRVKVMVDIDPISMM